ncbi:MAG: YciI family protein [Pyrinomonadaceae bacterium]|nr:YciI family protein [Pyrinomonadaceae bacterium]
MKIILAFLIGIIAFSFNALGQTATKEKPSKDYDAKLAKKLGADDLGMKAYVFAMLKRGKIKFDDAQRQELINGHMKNIGRLADEGKLVLAGPFMDDQDWRGIYIFDVKTVEEAQKLVETDPAIKAGVFEVELHPWYGSATLIEIPKMHKKIQKKTF